MKWFTGVKNVQELKKQHKDLLKLYHPDSKYGRVEIAQEINEEYNKVLEMLNRRK
ncbi:MAG: hypothetical protein J6A75_06615 [Lachnospiraceae bacterium]|nr:hypothetical protein [Lachnospiraceae bacterium]